MLSDAELLAAWQGGDSDAGRALTGRYFDSLYGFFRNKVGGDIDDLLQQTMLACVEARARFEGRSSFRTFLFAIARNVLFAHMRRRHRDRALDFEEVSVQDLGTTPSQHVEQRQQAKLLAHALRRVPLDHQIALELYYWEQLSSSEIADVLGVPAPTVRTRLRRGRLQVEAQLRRLAEGETVLQSTLAELALLAERAHAKTSVE